jgi:hypothetical protein
VYRFTTNAAVVELFAHVSANTDADPPFIIAVLVYAAAVLQI